MEKVSFSTLAYTDETRLIDPALIGINIYAGLLLAELSLDPAVHNYVSEHQYLFSVNSFFLMVIGLFFMSYPEENPEWARWSMTLYNLGNHLFPYGSETPRFYPALGTILLAFGINFNSTAKRVLSNTYLCWMGKVSFGIYLLHAPLIRTLLTWMLYGLSSQPRGIKDSLENDISSDWIPLTHRWMVVVVVPVFYVLLYRIAHLWVLHVDPWCGRVTNWVEEQVFREDAKIEKPLLLA